MNYRKVIIATLIFIVILTVFELYTKSRTKVTAEISEQLLTQQVTRLERIARGLDNGTPVSVSRVVSDCSVEQRYRFDELLSNLATLNNSDLRELDALFGGCAYYYSSTQSVNVALLDREITTYRELLRLADSVGVEVDSAPAETWDQVYELEQERSLLMSSLVTIQAQIVKQLLAGETAQSANVQTLVTQGQEVRENIVWLDQQVDVIHKTLFSS